MATDVMQGLVDEAKKNKFSIIGAKLNDGDVVAIWDNISAFIEKQMLNQKAVHLPGLGTFTFTQKKLDIGNNKFILIQRPVFVLSEKFAQTHGLQYTKHHVSGQIPVVQLNFSAISFESPFDRDAVEICVQEVLGALARSVANKRNVEFTFAGIGRLQIRESKVKMKFYKEFLNSMDGSGKLVDALKNRPGTVDSVMSDRAPSRAHSSNTLVLPRITHSSHGLQLDGDQQPQVSKSPRMPTITEDEAIPKEINVLEIEPDVDAAQVNDPTFAPDLPAQDPFDEVEELNEMDLPGILMQDMSDEQREQLKLKRMQGLRLETPPSRHGSRTAIPMAKATGVSFNEDFMQPPAVSAYSGGGGALLRASSVSQSSPAPLQPIVKPENGHATPSPPGLASLRRAKSMDRINLDKAPTPPGSACGHSNAGQELCYLCHQRARRNIPVSFTEERKRREEEEDRLLQQYQHMKDTESILKEQSNHLAKRHDNQKIAAFNLGVSEAVKEKGRMKPLEPPRAYIFNKRPLTPPRFIKQNELSRDLEKQVDHKDVTKRKRKADEDFLERLEQVQLAEDLAAQRETYLREKVNQTDQYRKALSAQLKFKPVPLPARVPDSNEPIFGKFDSTNEKLFEQKKRARDVFREQLDIVEQRKREAILRRLTDQKDEEEMLNKTKQELMEDRAQRYSRIYSNRKKLEEDWFKSTEIKKGRELEEKLRTLTPGILVHEQCDKYKRCGQCKRKTNNCGESNIWSESRYIPGSRLMV
ncbi:coiled-coil domain-containing protein 81 [Lingula anatina]|uniref:Coiled-coil domain-containing protein 81 n=1 Tax=Lingula anatina TaxID=7574 RepID=A0A1S3HGJ9_LINAN|nr:coiled-coil domain-containing protein 81 [Lingula anatina]|eukprot:XP_013385182.1 coiled-coil domain-containing protein 81 [Lingula anatina]